MKCGLLGRRLGHSYSPQIHAMLGAYSYSLFEKEPEELEEFLKNGDFHGINVTVPYKKTVIPYLDELTPIARHLGAVNTIIRRNGRLIGHNTDYYGFQVMLDSLPLTIKGAKVLVLGSGGASNTAAAVLRDHSADVIIISRTGENNYQNLYHHHDAQLIVNTTPVGMYPDNGNSIIDLKGFPKLQGVLDVIYNPARTKLLLDAEKRGLTTSNGLLMLVAQAKEASEWFAETTIPDSVIPSIMNKLQIQMQNIILIGMPGCGKSTIGMLLAKKTNRAFVDTDEEIVKMAGKSIPAIFSQDGEEVFRNLETQVLSNLCKQSSLIIATGGGCVTQKHNLSLLRQNGQIIWITRDVKSLPTDGRPLSWGSDLEYMANIRYPMYRSCCDIITNNDTTPQEAASQILAQLGENV